MAGSDVQSGSLQSPMGVMPTRKGVGGDGRRSEDGTWQVTLRRISIHGPTLSRCHTLVAPVNLKRLQTWTWFSEINDFF